MNKPHALGVSERDQLRIVLSSDVSRTSLRKYLAGGSCSPGTVRRIQRAAAELDITLPAIASVAARPDEEEEKKSNVMP